MTSLPFRTQQLLVSVTGTLLFVPLYLFWGGVFTLSFAAHDSIWAWGFGLVSCWSQILAVLVSYFKPRLAACWVLVDLAVSVVMAIGRVGEITHGHAGMMSEIEQWMQTSHGILNTTLVFWVGPALFALLLYRQDKRRVTY